MIRTRFKDPRVLLLGGAVLSLSFALAAPKIGAAGHSYDLVAAVDITGSMNTRDYFFNGKPVSRLEFAKLALRDLIKTLPCQSRLGLAIFTERRSFLLFEPIGICDDFAPLDAAIDSLDWRMAWQGDSHISAGLFHAIRIARDLNSDLLFFTDGHEAPPLPWSGGPPFEGRRGEVAGLIIGTGGYALSPIPKFDDLGNGIGFYSAEDVPHENRFGLPPPGAENREGYNPRNAPFGSIAASGTEHLSSVREPYLKELANITGLTYYHLDKPSGLAPAVSAVATPRRRAGMVELTPWFIMSALACLFLLYAVMPLIEGLSSHRERRLLDRSIPRRRVP
ncbi:MAG TPA: vWA domain-containing protein [Methylocella sp.]|nr:vWA domain-containing protein [Methylocella sp.]